MHKKSWFILLLCLCSIMCQAQNSADDYYRAGQYTKASKMFEKQLEEKFHLLTATKLAYCYRMTNRLEEAFDTYSKVVQSEKARPDTYFYFAEALTFREQYDSAKVWYERYLTANPKDDLGATQALQNLNLIKEISPYFTDIQIIPFTQNSDADDNSPFFFDNKIVFTSDRTLGFQVFKEKSGTTGRDYLNLYSSDIKQDSILESAKLFSNALQQKNANSGAASFTADKKHVYFEQNSTTASKNGAYNIQIFTAEAEGNGWKNVEKLPFCNAENSYLHPAISPDGTALFFAMKNNANGMDIYYTQRQANGHWKAIENLGEIVNTPSSEGFPFVDRIGRLYFSSKGHTGYGGFDIFMTEKDANGNWKKPVNLGKPINSSLDDISFTLFRNGTSGAFSSARDGGDDDIYFFKHKDSLTIFEKTVVAPITTTPTTIIETTTTTPSTTIINENPAETPQFKNIYEKLGVPTFNQLYEALHNKANTYFDSSGIKKTYILEHITFDDENISSDSLANVQLDSLLDLLSRFPIKVQFLIHTSDGGKVESNLENSKKIGVKLIKILTNKGISKEQIRSKGMGEGQPLCTTQNCADIDKKTMRLINQRIEIKVLDFMNRER